MTDWENVTKKVAGQLWEKHVPSGYSPEQSYTNTPNYEKLGRTERWVMDRLPGFSEGAIGKTLKWFGGTWAGKALMKLDFMAEGLERGVGFLAQWDEAAKTGTMGQFREELATAWYAGSLIYDVTDVPTLREDGAWEIPSDLPGMAGVISARQKIGELVRGGMDIGDALVQVRDEMYNNAGALALRMQLHDAFGHIVLDPMNYILPKIRPIERIRVLEQNARKLRAIPGMLEPARDAARVALSAAQETGDAAKIADATQVLKNLENMRELNWAEQKLIQFTGGFPGAPPASKWNPFALTPESRAYEYLTMVQDNFTSHVIAQSDDVDEWLRVSQRLQDAANHPELAHLTVTYEGRALLAESKIISSVLEDGITAFRVTQNERDMLAAIASHLDDTPYNIMTRLRNGEDVAVYTQYMEKLAQNPAYMEAFQEFLQNMGRTIDDFSAEDIAKIATTFGDSEIYTLDLLKMTMNNRIADAIAKQSIVMGGLKARGFLPKVAHMVKSAETLAFLRLNPTYPIKNFLNNEFTMLARGVYGFTLDDATKLWTRLGFEPSRLKTGWGAAEIAANVARGDVGAMGAAANKAITGAIFDATQGTRGWTDKVADFFSGVNLGKLDTGQMAAQIESRASIRAFTAGYMRGWNQYFWRGGKGFDVLGDFNPAAAAELGDEVVATIHRGIEGSMTPGELDDLLLDTNLNLTRNNILAGASDKFGADIKRVLTEEFTEQIMPGIVDAAKKGPTALADEMGRVRNAVQTQIDNLVDESISNLILETAARVEVEGPGAFTKLWGDVVDEWYGTHERHAMDMSRLADKLRVIEDPSIANAAWNSILERNNRYFGRSWNRFEARMQGMSNAAKKIGLPNADEVMTNFRRWRGGWEDFFKWRNKELRNFFGAKLKGKEYRLTFEQITEEANRHYATLVDAEDVFMRRIDNITAQMLPEGQRPLFIAWREAVGNARRADRELVIAFRDNPLGDGRRLIDLTDEEKALAYQPHWQQRMAQWNKITEEERAGLAALMGDPAAQARYAGLTDEALLARLPEPAEGTERLFQGRPAEYVEGWAEESRSYSTDYRFAKDYAGEGGRVVYQDVPKDIIPDAAEASYQSRLSVWIEGGRRGPEPKKSDLDILLGQEYVGKSTPVSGIPTGAEVPYEGTHLPDYHSFVPREMYMGTGVDQLWFTRGDDALNAIQESASDLARQKPLKFGNLSEAGQSGVRGYLTHVKGQMSDARYQSIRFGEFMRDSALLNYNRRFNYNTWLGTLMPYEFWMTQSIWKWAVHSIDRPAMLTTYLRMQKLLETGFRPEAGLPSRLRGSIRIPMPFMPDWMNKELFIDPLRSALPFKTFAYPFEQAQQQEMGDIGSAQRVLGELMNDGQISEQDYNEALQSQSGPIWERAISLARQDDTEGRYNTFDLLSMLTSPHAPLLWAYNSLRGEKERTMPFMPITRSIKGLTALLGIGPAGGMNPEAAIRQHFGLPAFDQWDDYRIDRMLSNMAADGAITVDDALRAMINREGDAFIEAERRAGIEFGWGAMGSLIGIPAKAYPEGEEHLRQLKDDYQQAWTNYEGGDLDALNEFYDAHPEYETRLALFKTPQERLTRFVIDEIWDRYNEMPNLHKQEVREHLGELFQMAFLNKETRSYDSIPPEILQTWLKIIGGDPPGQVQYTETLTPMEFTDPEVAWRLQAFFDTREEYFDYNNTLWPIQRDYFRLEEGAARRVYR